MRFHSSRERGSYRAWLWWTRDGASRARFEFSWRAKLCLIAFEYDDESGWGATWAIPYCFLSFSTNVPRRLRLKRDRTLFKLSLHGGSIWWECWSDPMGWSSTDPKWQRWSFSFVDFLLGKSSCETRTIEEREVLVPMPEQAYPARAKLVEYSWSRPRWFTKRVKRVEIDLPNGIPHAGKGENSWDCGDDATFGLTTGECNSIPEGVGILVGSCLRTRVKYGGWGDYAWSREAAE